MQLVYSAFNNDLISKDMELPANLNRKELVIRIKAHEQVCKKYSAEISRIKQYLPHWQPAFKFDNSITRL